MAGFRPLPLLATILTALALAFYIVALASSTWLLSANPNVQIYNGIYNSCWRQYDAGINECRYVDNECDSDFSSPVNAYSITSMCNSLRAVRALEVMATVMTGLAFFCFYMQSFTRVPYYPLRFPGLMVSFTAGLFGLIGWAIFIAIARDKGDDWEYGYGFGLATAAWVLNWVSCLFAAVPWPYSPFEYDRDRLLAAQGAPVSETEEERQRREAAAAGRPPAQRSWSDAFWSLFGVSPEKRQSYAERWSGEGGTGRRREEAARQRQQQEEGAGREYAIPGAGGAAAAIFGATGTEREREAQKGRSEHPGRESTGSSALYGPPSASGTGAPSTTSSATHLSRSQHV